MRLKMKIAVITSGYLPVPATKGGAVENIVENLISENEKNIDTKFLIYSIENDAARKEAQEKYKNSEFVFIKVNKLVKCLDKMIYWIAKNVLKKSKTMSYRYIMQRLSFLNKVSKQLKKNEYDKIVLENHATLFFALKWRENYKKYEGKYYYHVHN